jgi:hypothetical protein
VQFFMSECEPVQYHGEECTKQIHCTMSGDPHLHCIGDVNGGGMKCQCRKGYTKKVSGNCYLAGPGRITVGRLSKKSLINK